jgi:hypothetical protein
MTGRLYRSRKRLANDFSPWFPTGSAWHPFSQEVGREMAALQQSEHPLSDNAASMFAGMGVPQAGPPVVGAGGASRWTQLACLGVSSIV